MTARPLPCPTAARCLALGLLLLLAVGELASAETFTVSNVDDSGAGSLREAIIDLNLLADPDNTIVFELPDDSTITLMSPLEEISVALEIDGTTATNLTIQGDGIFELFRVAAGTTLVQDTALDADSLEIATGSGLAFGVSADQTQTFSGDITDTPSVGGALQKIGDGTLILLGVNDYQGGTLVSQGTLQGNHQSLQGTITTNAALVFDQQTNGMFVGTINGLGSVEKTGPEMLTITGVNTYTGGTTVSQGILKGDTNSIQGDIVNNDVVILDQSMNGTYAGAMSGSGRLEMNFVNLDPTMQTLTLTGANTYSGGTRVTLGILKGDAVSIQGKIDLVGADTGVNFEVPGSGIHSGDITGAGLLHKTGAGTLTLLGENDYAGTTFVEEGTLRGNATSLQGTIFNNSALFFDQSTDGIFAGQIMDGMPSLGAVTKTGAGRLTFSQANTYSGPTTISAGQLDINNDLSSADVQVDAGATLGGTGNLAGSVTVDGAVAPGIDIGVLRAGAVIFRDGSTLEIDIKADGTGDLLAVTNATIMSDSIVVVNPAPGNYLTTPSEISILTSTSARSGDFLPMAIPDFAFLTLTLLPSDDMDLKLRFAANGRSFDFYAQTPNQRAVAAGLDSVPQPAMGDLAIVFQNLETLSVAEVPVALDDIGGESLTQFATTRLAIENRFQSSIQARIRGVAWRSVDPLIARSGSSDPLAARRSWLPATPAPGMSGLAASRAAASGLANSDVAAGFAPEPGQRGFGAWIDGFGLFGDIDGDSNASDVDYTIGGSSLGFDFRVTDNLLLGIAGGYAYTDVDFGDLPGSGEANTLQGAVYGGYVTPRFYVGLAGRYAYNDMETSRRIAFGSIDRRAKGDFDGYDVGGRAEAGVNLFEVGGVAFQPLASFDYTHLQQDGYTESGATSLDLRVNSESLDSLMSRVGLRVHGEYQIGEDNWLVPELRAQWTHEFGDRDRQMDGRITGATSGGAWTVQGAELARDGLVAGTGWTVSAGEQLFFFADYDVILNQDLIQHSVALGFRLAW